MPDEPIDLPVNERLVHHVERENKATTLQEMIELAAQIGFSKQDIAEMNAAIEEDCERVEPSDQW